MVFVRITNTMTGNVIIALLSFTAILLAFCNGETFYVRPDNETSCPPTAAPANATCRLISEYAADQSLLSNDTHVDLCFLPGLHTLLTDLYIFDRTALTLQPLEPERNTTITCDPPNGLFYGGFYIENFDSVKIRSLEFHSCFSRSKPYAPWFTFDEVKEAIVENCIFTNNDVTAIESQYSNLIVTSSQFTYSSSDELIRLFTSNATFTDNRFANNIGTLILYESNLTTTGTNIFDGNSKGVLDCYSSMVVFNGTTNFTNNHDTSGGVFYSSSSQFIISGDVAFINNNADRYGGAYYLESSAITFVEGNVTFINNSAIDGGALYMASNSILNFTANFSGSVLFNENWATSKGGAVFIQDSNNQTYCLSTNDQIVNVTVAQECFFQASIDYDNIKTLSFSGNCALEAGSVIYGGALDSCFLRDSRGIPVSGAGLFDQIADFGSNSKSNINPSEISSDPFMVCICDGSEPNCTSTSVPYMVYPGAYMEVRVVALGQRNGTVPATAMANLKADGLPIENLDPGQNISGECSSLYYTIYAEPGSASLELYTEGTCLPLTIELEVLSCPPGFVKENGSEGIACMCDTRLYFSDCYIQNGKIQRHGGYWVGYINDPKSNGIIFHPNCPFDYCNTNYSILFNVKNESNAQCNHYRSGTLCGECPEGRSLFLGSSRQCRMKCSSNSLVLLLFFGAAGLILVALLLLLNLTVAVGTINGLVFYVNIVAANERVFFTSDPKRYLYFLKVLIAWINLDFGIEICFYDGMDAYAKTWLQYAFPAYIWTLIVLVFVVAHFSSRVSKYLGSNPVAVLATLILLSYTNILHTITEAFSSTKLYYPQDESRLVWPYDGNVPFLDASDGRHTGLFVASLVLTLLFIPYTLLLLTSQWLQIKSHWKVLSWLNKPQLRSFLDAYHAPYKPRHRYWTGLLLLVRFALLLTIPLTSFTNPSVNLLVIQILVLFMLTWAWISGGVYKKRYLNILEGFFFLNLGLLATSTRHIQFVSGTEGTLADIPEDFSSEEDIYMRSQAAITSTLVAATIVTFIGIVTYHIYLSIRGTAMMDKLLVATRPSPAQIELKEHVKSKEKLEVSTSYVTLREPLLEDN